VLVFNSRKFFGLILQFQLLQKVTEEADVGSSEIDTDTVISNEHIK
jgi:hypothetical protein